jgi:hypothetical protein
MAAPAARSAPRLSWPSAAATSSPASRRAIGGGACMTGGGITAERNTPSPKAHGLAGQCEGEFPVPKSAGDQAGGEDSRRYLLAGSRGEFHTLPKNLSRPRRIWLDQSQGEDVEAQHNCARPAGLPDQCDRLFGSRCYVLDADVTEQRALDTVREEDAGQAGVSVGARQFGCPGVLRHRVGVSAAGECLLGLKAAGRRRPSTGNTD